MISAASPAVTQFNDCVIRKVQDAMIQNEDVHQGGLLPGITQLSMAQTGN
jgi:hypothetical protein